MTQKSKGGKTLVYNSDKKELTSVNLNDYDVTYDSHGRKNNVVVVPVTQSEVLLSQVVSETIAQSIIEASNKGPQAIIVQIDNPGGRGDYMKIITSAITQTQNCPVYAYISDKQYGGAFSSAAMIAMACDKVFISPTASVGAAGPIIGTAVSDEDILDYLSTYCSDSLVSYNTYAVALAHEQNRPPLIVRSLIDKSLSVEEVTNFDGTRRDYVQKDERKPNQTRVRTLAEGYAASNAGQSAAGAQAIGSVLNLPSSIAIEVGLADSAANSLTDILTEMNLRDVQLTNTSGIDNTIKKYSAARRNIAVSLSRIDWLENRSAILDEQRADIEKQLRTGTVTREVSRRENAGYHRGTYRLPENYDRYYYDPDSIFVGSTTSQSDRYANRSLRHRTTEVEKYTTERPATDINEVRQELIGVLADLMVEYRRAMSQAKRWPGSLPPEISYSTLEQNGNSAALLRDYLIRESSLNLPTVP